jgi:hypothetical protein
MQMDGGCDAMRAACDWLHMSKIDEAYSPFYPFSSIIVVTNGLL